MTGQDSRCPDPEVLAAFVAGTLEGEELKMTADHLRECDDCTEIVGDAAWVGRQRAAQAPEAASLHKRWPFWLSVAAAALAAVAYLALRPHGATPVPPGAIALLVEAAPKNGRSIEARLTGGFPWAPLRSSHRGAPEPLDAGQMKLIGAAGVVIERTAQDRSAAAQHAAALAHLLAGRPEEAVGLLSATAPSGSDARIWSDLAAARYAAAIKNDDHRQLAEALADADMALRLDPKFPEALFNRALIVERLGLRDQARAAWDRYLAVDGGSPWAAEAREHVRNLAPLADFRDEFLRQYDALARDPESAKSLARRYPREVRVWGETEVLARWAEALQRRDEADAERHLRVAEAFAEVTRVDHGEHMLQAAVDAIRRASAAQRPKLAEAHLTFRAAQRMYKSKNPVAAEPMFVHAAEGFERAGSPMALLARYFAANTIYDQGRIDEALARLSALWAAAPRQFPAHRAQVEWELGMAQASRGRWGDAMQTFADSVSTFERLGETASAAAVRDMLAEAYDRIGDRRSAWDHRIIALRGLGRFDPKRLQISLDAAARAAAVNREWPVSASFLGLELELGNGDEFQYAETLLLRALIEARMAQYAAANADVRNAREAIARLHDQALRERAEADGLAVEGFVTLSPSDAVPLLGRAIEFHAGKGRRMLLPEMFLYRGRALAAMGKVESAASDFEAGIRELERQQLSVDRAKEPWWIYSSADELFDEAVALAAGRGDVDTAFAYTERARARDLWDATGVTVARPATATDDVVIEYASLPARLIIFVAEGGRVRAVESAVARATLTADADRLTRSAMMRDATEFRRAASALYQCLFAPVARDIPAGRLLVFVPDASLSTVPFAALLDGGGQYIIERHPVVVAPSAGVFASLSRRSQRSSGRALHLLLIAGPSFSDGSILRSEQREVDLVSAAYGRDAKVAPKGSDGAAFEAQAANADVIHFVGHAVIPDESADGALVTWGENNAAGRLGVREIAAMRLKKSRAVVLAACATARTRTGERSISIAHAFLAAGVPSVVATLWPIEDEPAADFFPRFHRHLAQGLSPAEALRATQIAWIHRTDAPPGMWAAVQLIGS